MRLWRSNILLSLSPAVAFSFSYSTPTACSPITFSWLAGSPPFNILVAPVFGMATNISVPVELATTSGSFNTILNLDPGTRFLLAMSDANGFASGGVSPVLTAAVPSPSVPVNSSCATQKDPPFTFQADLSLRQCSNFVFNGYSGAVLPIRFFGLIPRGDTIALQTSDASQLVWPVNVAAGTAIMFIAVDAKDRSGGATDLLNVVASNNASCLNSLSPSSTGGLSSPSAAPPLGANSAIKSSNAAVIGGAISGTIFGLLLAITLLFLYCRHRKSVRNDEERRTGGQPMVPGRSSTRARMRPRNNIQLIPEGRPLTPMQQAPTSVDLLPNPYIFPSSPIRSNEDRSQSEDNGHLFSGSFHTRRVSKSASMRTSVHTPRLVLHTDVESEEEVSSDASVLELPPQYKSTRKSLNIAS